MGRSKELIVTKYQLQMKLRSWWVARWVGEWIFLGACGIVLLEPWNGFFLRKKKQKKYKPQICQQIR